MQKNIKYNLFILKFHDGILHRVSNIKYKTLRINNLI